MNLTQSAGSLAPPGGRAAPRPRAALAARVAALPGLLPALTLVLVVAAWQAAVSLFDVADYLVPPPADVWRSLVDQHALLLEHGRTTLVETLWGFALSAAVGIPLAVAMKVWPLAGRALYPLLVSSQIVPKVAVAPLFVVWIGTGTTTSALIAFVMAFFPVVVNTSLGLDSVDRESLMLIRSMGGRRRHAFRYLLLPASLPHMWTGLKLAMAFAVVGAIVGEFVGSQSGLGYLLIVAQGNLDTALIFADLVVLTVGGLLLYYAVDLIGRRVVRWS